MDKLEDFIIKNLALFTLFGLLLRVLLYGVPRVNLIWVYLSLSLLVGVGGVFLSLAKDYKLSTYYVVGCVFVLLGLLPFQLLL
jgi:hypothetical protein